MVTIFAPSDTPIIPLLQGEGGPPNLYSATLRSSYLPQEITRRGLGELKLSYCNKGMKGIFGLGFIPKPSPVLGVRKCMPEWEARMLADRMGMLKPVLRPHMSHSLNS